LFFGNAIRNNTAAATCRNPVIGSPYPPNMIKQSAITFSFFDVLSIVFIVFSVMKLSENIETMF
jgi:hypothetical protein